ncbi:kinase-like protein [Corynespora cassiicola Philippines]|uniref:Kinase-like protein n=1 Tax=Corynespora cassiicola Philippines TaxID=1448308 RepID=A0A2T2P4M1_CORCC|nr:kinase-like protein [Corynespora cassiicola Philippines]
MASPDRDEIEEALSHMIPRGDLDQYIDEAVFLEIARQLTKHPDKHISAWSESPRLYTMLRIQGYDIDSPVFQKFANENVSDYWLPIAKSSLAQLASPGMPIKEFSSTQLHVLSKPDLMSEEKLLSPNNAHRHILDGAAHFKVMDHIGRGGSAEVSRVRHILSGRPFACKRISRADRLGEQKKQLVEFELELNILKRINHRHCVNFVASFSDSTSFSLILEPVADESLKFMLQRQNRAQPLSGSDLTVLRSAFGCIATALAYLHGEKVRHKDIKPGNILISGHRVYLCDFGISRDWSSYENSTTEGEPQKFTRRYCSPEVINHEARNTSSDIWSLGCVFLELVSVIKGYPLEEVNEFLRTSSNGQSDSGFWCAPEAMRAWLAKIQNDGRDSADNLPVKWINAMIRADPDERPKASGVVTDIYSDSVSLPQRDLFIGSCCARFDSVIPIETVDSPTLTNPDFQGLGIVKSSGSYLPTFLDQRSSIPQNNHRYSSDRSISPHDVTEDDRHNSGASPSQGRLVRNILVHPDSHRASHSSFSEPSQSLSIGTQSSDSYIQRPSDASMVQHFELMSPIQVQKTSIPLPESPLKCLCAARPLEKHILNLAFDSSPSDSEKSQSSPTFTIDVQAPTIETCSECESLTNKVQLYETQLSPQNETPGSMPQIWCVTRRMAVSYLSGSPEMRRCSSFWLPLADMQFNISDNTVILQWSDCSQMTTRHVADYQQRCDWIYNPQKPNNKVTVRFNNSDDAELFIDTVRLPFGDGFPFYNERKIEVSKTSELHVFDVGRPGLRNYRTATVTKSFPQFRSSKLFVQYPQLDVDLQACYETIHQEYYLKISLRNVSFPTYISNITEEPAEDGSKVARFQRARLRRPKDAALETIFPLGASPTLPDLPKGVIEMLKSLTGWTLRYFGLVTSFKSKRTLFDEKYGKASVLLWEKENETRPPGRTVQRAVLTLRMHEEIEFLWLSGSIEGGTTVSNSENGKDATLSVSHVTKGKLLEEKNMEAIPSTTQQKSKHSRSNSSSATHTHESSRKLVLCFPDVQYRRRFGNIVEDFESNELNRHDSLASNSLMKPMHRHHTATWA